MASKVWFCFSRRPGVRLSDVLALLLFLTTAFVDQSAFAKPRPPWPPHPEVWLNAWRFDDPEWLTNGRTAPLVFLNAAGVESWSGHALSFAGPNPALLALPEFAPDGATNFLAARGAIRFWFAPDWTSAPEGDGPGAEARLLEFGAWSGNGAAGWWALGIAPSGNAIRFFAQGAGGTVTVLEASIHWCAGEWHQVTLAWSATGQTLLYLDGQLAAMGEGVSFSPLTSFDGVRGFALGSDVTGGQLAQGQFDELLTFARPSTAAEVAEDYRLLAPSAALGPISPEEEQFRRNGMMAQSSAPPDPGDAEEGGAPAGEPTIPPDYGCALWLSLSPPTNGNVLLTLHNTIPGTNYQILSRTNIAASSWTLETNVAGTSGQDFTQKLMPTNGHPNKFYIASETKDYVVGTNFAGLGFTDTEFGIPDTMGAVGSNHFVELLIGGVAVFSKTNGTKMEQLSTQEFFAAGQIFGTNAGTMCDHRLLYDHQSQRWIAAAIDCSGTFQAVLAVSKTNNPTGLLTNWDKYLITVRSSNAAITTDYLTLGVDTNGIYLTVLQRQNSANAGHTIVAIKKPEIYQGTLVTNRFDIDTSITNLKVWTIQPAVNYDAVSTNGYAWLVGKGPRTNGLGGGIVYRRLQWSNTTARLVDNQWQGMVETQPAPYRDYYDIEGTNRYVPAVYGSGLTAPQSGGTNRIALNPIGSRLMNAMVRGGFLYTCHVVGLSGTNGSYSGDDLGSSVDRAGVQWIKSRIETTNVTLHYYDHGRIYDAATSNTLHFYFPSIAANCSGDMVMGFSGSSSNSFIGAYYAWRPANNPLVVIPVQFHAGTGHFVGDRWGDYSATILDPSEPAEFWTVQQYAVPSPDGWETWIARIARKR